MVIMWFFNMKKYSDTIVAEIDYLLINAAILSGVVYTNYMKNVKNKTYYGLEMNPGILPIHIFLLMSKHTQCRCKNECFNEEMVSAMLKAQ